MLLVGGVSTLVELLENTSVLLPPNVSGFPVALKGFVGVPLPPPPIMDSDAPPRILDLGADT